MKVNMPLVMWDDEGHDETITDVVVLEKACQQIEPVGLTLAEAKTRLTALQQRIVARQVAALLSGHGHCQACGQVLRMTEHHFRTFRTLFGTITCTSPRLPHCPCTPHPATTFSPLTRLWSEPTAPALLVMETTWAALVSYGVAVQALQDFLPREDTLSGSTVRTDALAVAQRCEADLEEDHWSCIAGCPRHWGHLPMPDGPITVGIDGGDVRDWDETKRQVEVSVGKSRLAFRRDEEEVYILPDAVVRELERLKWLLWHGNVYRALQVVESVEMDLDVVAVTGDGTARKLFKAMEEFHTYIDRNRAFIPNDGERYRYGERISTGFVESMVNQVISKRFCKRQQMQWTKRGAHLLLQTRVKTLDHELGGLCRTFSCGDHVR